MNRLWKQFFGTGLCKVLDDLGAQGEPPANPALLDWLACEFMDSGWDVKHMVRMIVTSHTYRRASTAAEGAAPPRSLQPRARPAEPLPARCRTGARQRARHLRPARAEDRRPEREALSARRLLGESELPDARMRWRTPARAQYRRGLYTWWQRTFLHPSLLAFDAPSREECAAERNRSNIPQQALVLLNDPTYVEAARAFAARILSECKGTTEERIAWAWQQALQRSPRPTR